MTSNTDTEEHRPTAAVVQSQEARGRGEGASATPSPRAPLRLWSWSTSAQKPVVRDTAVSSEVAPAAERELALQDVETGTVPPSPVVLKPEIYRPQIIEGIAEKPQEKAPPAAGGEAGYLGRALLMYSGRCLSDPPRPTKKTYFRMVPLLLSIPTETDGVPFLSPSGSGNYTASDLFYIYHPVTRYCWLMHELRLGVGAIACPLLGVEYGFFSVMFFSSLLPPAQTFKLYPP